MTEPAGPSQTARRVAAYRLGFERVAAPASGDPDADDRLTADVAAGVTVDRAGPMGLRGAAADPARRARFDTRVAAPGEPAIGSITADDGEALLSDCGWRPVELTERARTAGFIMAAPS